MQHVTAALAAPRLLRHARRALLLLGAAFVWWLLFSGGAAQADDGGQSADQAASSVQQADEPAGPTPEEITAQAAAAVDESLREAPGQVTDAVLVATRTAPEPVRTTVVRVTTGLEPKLTATTSAVADTVGRTARPVVRPAPATSAAAHPRVHVQAPRHQRHHRAVEATTPQQASYADTAVSAGGADRVSAPAGSPANPTPGLPVAPSAPAVPAGSGSGPSGPFAALGGLLLVPPAVRRRRRTCDRALRRPAPALRPGCSPD